MRRDKLKSYFQLVRLPNVFTAAADSLAGWLWIGGRWNEWRVWIPLILISMFTYAAGIALNDVFDLEIDRLERPNRPLPSGTVSPRFAALLSAGLLTLGLVLALIALRAGGVLVVGLLVLCVLLYDLGLKRSIFGPEVMGACRTLNFSVGLCAGDAVGSDLGTGAGIAFAIGLFVVGLTWISRSETLHGRRKWLAAGYLIQIVALVVLGTIVGGQMPRLASNATRTGNHFLSFLCLGLVFVFISRAASLAWRTPIPSRLQNVVKTSVFSLIWLDVAVVAGARGPLDALIVASLWAPSYALGRWIYST